MASGEHAQLFGVLGDPIDHSLSPAMHNAAFAATGLPHLYLRFRVAPVELAAALGEARRLRVAGLNLTVPLKETVLPLLDALTPEAGRIGAVNTILFDNRGWMIGDNTDGRGFLASLRGLARVRGATVVIIGAGGSARAVGTALVRSGCRRVVVANRTAARGERLAERLAGLGATDVRAVPLDAVARGDVLEDAAVVVNTTPVGLHGAPLRVRAAASPRRCLFVDLVYGRPTPFLGAAARAGRRTMDGSGMLLHQGILAFEAWTGRRAPRAAMARALRAAGLALTEAGIGTSFRDRRPPTP